MKSEIKEKLRQALSRVQNSFARGKFATKEKLNLLEPVKIQPYYGFGSDHYVFIKGRVLEAEGVREKLEDSSKFKHLKDTY